MSKVVHAAKSAPVVVAANWKGQLQIWNSDAGELLAEFATVFDGNNRLAVSPAGDVVVTANWGTGQNGGVACYETSSGKRMWHREDLGQVQQIKFSAQGDWIWCEVNNRPVHCLDLKSGSTLKEWSTVQDVIDSSSHTLAARPGDFVIGSSEKSASVPRLSGSELTAAFAPRSVCICEYSNPTIRPTPTIEGWVRCIDCESAVERWRYHPPKNHFIQLISYQNDGSFYVVQSGCESNGWVVALVRLSAEDGTSQEICNLQTPPPYFGGFGDGVLVTPDGDVASLGTGEIKRKLKFG